MLKTIQQRQLIEQDGAQGKAASVAQALRRYLTVAIEDALEPLGKIIDGHRAVGVKTRRTSTPSPVCGSGTVLRRHPDPPGPHQPQILDVRRVGGTRGQDKTGFKRQFPQQSRGSFVAQPRYGGVRSAASEIQTAAAVTTQ